MITLLVIILIILALGGGGWGYGYGGWTGYTGGGLIGAIVLILVIALIFGGRL